MELGMDREQTPAGYHRVVKMDMHLPSSRLAVKVFRASEDPYNDLSLNKQIFHDTIDFEQP